MKILAIETATESCSVALLYNDQVIHRFQHQPQQQAQLVLPMVDELMAEAGLRPAELDALSFGRGPGSFTGLRIAAAVTQGIAVACDLPVIPVSTLAVLAQTACRCYGAGAVLAAIDARMQEVYWAEYSLDETGLVQLLGDEIVVAPEEVSIGNSLEYIGAGSGWRTYESQLKQKLAMPSLKANSDCWPHAQDMLPLAKAKLQVNDTVSAEHVEPVYIRDKVAKSLAERKAQ